MYLIVLVVLYCVTVSCPYHQFHCPSRTEWRTRANWNCNHGSSSAIYTCLFNVFNFKYEEACKYKPAILDPGEQYILSHSPVGEHCKTVNKYQPFPLSLNMSSECLISKSRCNEEGQVLFYNGSSKEDRSCRCNFKNGYAFVNKPKHPCKCIPASEDCSCYMKQCSLHFQLVQDYSCVHNDNKTYISLCPDMLVTRSRRLNATSDVLLLRIEKHYDKRSNIISIFVSTILGLLLFGPLALVVLCQKMPGLFYHEISPPYNFDVTREGTSLKLTWSKPRKGSEDITEYRIYYTCKSTWTNTPFTVKGADNLCFCVTSKEINFAPRTTYRFTISAYTSNLEESVQSDEKKFDTGLIEQPQNFEIDGRNGTITLAWSSPRETLLNTDNFKLDVIQDSVKTDEQVLSAGTFEYTIEKATHAIYCFRIYSCFNELLSEPLERTFIGNHAYQADMKLDVINNNRIDEHDERLEHLEKIILNIFADGTKDIPGEQEIVKKKIRIGSLLLELVFTSQHFYDEKGLRRTIKNAFESNSIKGWELNLSDFSFKAINGPCPPKSVQAIYKDNIATVTWREPTVTFFETKRFIVKVMKTYKSSSETKEYNVPNHQMAYSVFGVLPSTTIEFTIYTAICHSIRSCGSNAAVICNEGSTLPHELKATCQGSTIKISWTKPLHPIIKFVKHFEIKITDDQTTFYDVVSGDTFEYEVKNCKPSTHYWFEVSALTSNERESKTSKTVEILTPEKVNENAMAQVPVEKTKVNENAMAQVHVKQNILSHTGSFVIERQHTVMDVNLLQSGKLVLTDRYQKQLITCLVNGDEMKNIQINGFPLCIAEIDAWNVAVSLIILDDIDKLRYFEITLVDIKKMNVTRNIGKFPCVTPSCPITFANDKLYIHATSGEIEVMDIYGDRKTKIDLSNSAVTLSDISYVNQWDSICGMSIDGKQLISVGPGGICRTIYAFKDDSFSNRQLLTDKDGNYLILCSQTYQPGYEVYKLRHGEPSRVQLLSSKINTKGEHRMYASFCVQNLPKPTIVVVKNNEVHVYSYTK